jgi:hypothetical protein
LTRQQRKAWAARLPVSRRDELLACLRWDDEGSRRLEQLSDEDWHDLIAVIEEGRGHALLARRLARPGHAANPPEHVVQVLQDRQKKLAARAFRSTLLLVQVVERAQRPALFLKGIDIAQRIYGGYGMRAMSDVDLLVRPSDAARFHDALTALGFRTQGPPTAARQAETLWSQAAYDPPRNSLYPLDLHWRLGKREHGIERDIDTDAIWARAEPYAELGRTDVLVMSREDLLLYLCLHLRHHTYDSPLTQVWDIAEVLEWSGSRFDWDAFWLRAAEWQLTKTVSLALLQAHRTLGVAVPVAPAGDVPPEVARLLPDVLPNLGAHRNRRRVAEPHVADLFAPAIPARRRLARLWNRLVPAREEIAARFSLPPRSWRVFPQYFVYWRHQTRDHGHFVFRWLAGDRDMREQSDRIHGLSQWLASGRPTTGHDT